ncbi:hypothetical protein EDD11_010172 [Mortierella claussenii]|nr:hypothetical protein EDD11_010172 [Mortierella claussenii]
MSDDRRLGTLSFSSSESTAKANSDYPRRISMLPSSSGGRDSGGASGHTIPGPGQQPSSSSLERPTGHSDSGNILTENAIRPDAGGRLPSTKIYHYDVAITPDLPPQRARQLWIQMERDGAFNTKAVFDGRANAFAPSEINGIELGHTFEVELPNDGGRRSKSNPNVFKVKIAFVAAIDVASLKMFLQKAAPLSTSCLTAIQALNVALTHKPFSMMTNVGRSIYTPDGAQNLQGGLEKWDGIFQSIRTGERQAYVNIDTTATAFIRGGTAVEVIADVLQQRLSPRSLDSYEISKVEGVLKGCKFAVNRGDFKRKFTLAALSKHGADATLFNMTLNDGSTKRLSIAEYFLNQYGRRLQYPSLPCFGAKGKGDMSFFPAELCFIMPGQHYKKKLNEDQVTAMIKTTAIRPDARARKIRECLRILDFEHNQYLQAFNMRISTEMAVVPARILPAPEIKLKNGTRERPNNGAWQIRGFVQPAKLESWGILCCDREHKVSRGQIQNFVRQLINGMSSQGMAIVENQPPIEYFQPQGDIRRDIDSLSRHVERKCRRLPQLLVIMLAGKTSLYGAIKAHCETSPHGIMTQCAYLRKAIRADDQYCRMISLKINTKLGGIVSVLPEGSMPIMDRRSTLVIGADVSHPAPGEDKPSIASVVASMDDYCSKFVGRLMLQDSRQEVIENMQSLFKDLLYTYKNQTKHFPKRIICYRDGVSEGQFAEILRTEILSIKQACMEFDKLYLPPITFIVVKKRHHARFFPEGRNADKDRSGNCVPGTVIDTVLTHPSEFCFYLQSHAGIQGTSRSTLYHVVLDENKFTSDSLQQLTFNMCHIYSRCSRSLSIVPAVHYAHLLAFRARHYLDNGVIPEPIGGSQRGLKEEDDEHEGDAHQRERLFFMTPLGEIRVNVCEANFDSRKEGTC